MNKIATGGPVADPLIEGWRRFSGAADAHDFCHGWLEVQCALIQGVRSGLLVLRAEQGGFAPAAIWPDRTQDAGHLAATAEQALTTGQGLIQRQTGTAQLAYPIRIGETLEGAVVLEVAGLTEPALRQAMHALYWGAGWLEVLFRRRRSEADATDLATLRRALDLAVVALEEPDLKGASMALVNALADALGARNVVLGICHDRRLKIEALSQAAWFRKQSALLDGVLNAMEEVLDQHAPVSWPETGATAERISVAHQDLSRRTGAAMVLGVPLLAAGRPVGAILLEFDADQPVQADTVRIAEAVGAVCGTVLADRQKADRLLAGRLPRAVGRFWSDLRDPRQVAGKLFLAVALAVLAALVFARAPLRVTADALVEGAVQRAVVAPVDGFLEEAPARAGEIVAAGDLLARLDDRDLALENLRFESEMAQAQKEYRDAMARHDRVQAGLLQSRIAEADAQLRLIGEQRARMEIRAPIGGVIVTGDLSRELGIPVEKGRLLFEVAPLEKYRVILKVDERHILMVEPGQKGVMSLAAIAGQEIPLTVEKVTPVSTPEEGRNYFRVEAALDTAATPLRPGMEGVGKIAIREAPLAEVWTWQVVQWLRIQIWTWKP